MIAALVMIVAGWVGLYELVIHTLPLAFPRWLFFILLFLAVTGTALPFVRYLNLRFTPAPYPVAPSALILRQSIWFGLFAVVCAWLQIPRVLSWPVAFFLALSFIVYSGLPAPARARRAERAVRPGVRERESGADHRPVVSTGVKR